MLGSMKISLFKMLLSAIVLIPLAISCGGGGGGGDDDGDSGGGTAPPLTASFTSDLAVAPSSGYVALQYNVALSTASEPVFDVIIYGLLQDEGIIDNRVYGISFHLSFDEGMLSYLNTVFTDVLGDAINTETSLGPGYISIGMSRIGDIDGVVVPEAGTVFMRISFKAVSVGSSRLEFMDLIAGSDCGTPGHSDCHVLMNADQPVGTDVSQSWFGGIVDIV